MRLKVVEVCPTLKTLKLIECFVPFKFVLVIVGILLQIRNSSACNNCNINNTCKLQYLWTGVCGVKFSSACCLYIFWVYFIYELLMYGVLYCSMYGVLYCLCMVSSIQEYEQQWNHPSTTIIVINIWVYL